MNNEIITSKNICDCNHTAISLNNVLFKVEKSEILNKIKKGFVF